jgi:hypothetical protein
MENNAKLKEEIEGYYNYDYSQAETVELLLKKGFSETEIKTEIFNVYTEITVKDIEKSFSFIFTNVVIGLSSLTPLIDYVLEENIHSVLYSFLLLVTYYGYLKRNKISIIIWMCIAGLFILFLLIILFSKLLGMDVPSIYSYGLLILFISLGSVTLRNIYNVYVMNEKFRKQYKFK